MKIIQKILILSTIIMMSSFNLQNALSFCSGNHVRHCQPYCDNPCDDDNERTKYSKLFVIISSGNIDLGTFVRGATYDVEAPENEIEFEIQGLKAKRFNVILSNNGSQLTNRGVSITTEWRFSHDCGINDIPFFNGAMYFFWKKMILGCFITSITIPKNARSGNYSFEQVLTVYPTCL
jgi:hypothetical protein